MREGRLKGFVHVFQCARVSEGSGALVRSWWWQWNRNDLLQMTVLAMQGSQEDESRMLTGKGDKSRVCSCLGWQCPCRCRNEEDSTQFWHCAASSLCSGGEWNKYPHHSPCYYFSKILWTHHSEKCAAVGLLSLQGWRRHTVHSDAAQRLEALSPHGRRARGEHESMWPQADAWGPLFSAATKSYWDSCGLHSRVIL